MNSSSPSSPTVTTAYYNSLYLTSEFIQLYNTGQVVVSSCRPVAIVEVHPPHIQSGSFHCPSARWAMTSSLWCKRLDFHHGSFSCHLYPMSTFYKPSWCRLRFEPLSDGFCCSHEIRASLQSPLTSGPKFTKDWKGHETFWRHDGESK